MKFNLQTPIALALTVALAICTSVGAADAPEKKKKKNAGNRNNPAMNIMKQLADVELTEEQQSKIKEMAKESMAALKAAQKEAGITPEVMKKRAAAQKELKDSGVKGKELAQAINEKAGLTEAQAAGMAKISELRSTMMKGAIALLTDEQKAKLPERMARMAKAGKAGKGKGKKKKEKEAA